MEEAAIKIMIGSVFLIILIALGAVLLSVLGEYAGPIHALCLCWPRNSVLYR